MSTRIGADAYARTHSTYLEEEEKEKEREESFVIREMEICC